MGVPAPWLTSTLFLKLCDEREREKEREQSPMIDHNRLLSFEGVLRNVDARREYSLYRGLGLRPLRSRRAVILPAKTIYKVGANGIKRFRSICLDAPARISLVTTTLLLSSTTLAYCF